MYNIQQFLKSRDISVLVEMSDYDLVQAFGIEFISDDDLCNLYHFIYYWHLDQRSNGDMERLASMLWRIMERLCSSEAQRRGFDIQK